MSKRVTPQMASDKRRLPSGQIIYRDVPVDLPDEAADVLIEDGTVRLSVVDDEREPVEE